MTTRTWGTWVACCLAWAWGAACTQGTCADGEARVDGRCVRTCNANGDCDRTSTCVEGVCQSGRPNGADAGMASGSSASSGASTSFGSSSSGASASAGSSGSSASLSSASSSSGFAASSSASASTGGTSSGLATTSSSSGGGALALSWNGPAQAAAGACTPFEIQRDSAAGQALDILLSASASVSFHPGPNCALARTSVTMGATASSVMIYVQATQAGPADLTANVAATTAVHPFVVTPGSPALLTWNSPPQTLRVAQCSKPATLSLRDVYGNLTPPRGGATPVTATTPFASLQIYTDPACQDPAPLLLWTELDSVLTFHFRVDDVGTADLQVDAASQTATQPLQVVHGVRSGQCTMNSLSNQVSCAIGGPALQDVNRTWLVFQATATSAVLGYPSVGCALADPMSITCTRETPGAEVKMTWSVVEFAAPVRVQHLQANCEGQSTQVSLPAAVDPTHSFITASVQGSLLLGPVAGLVTAELLGGTTVELRSSTTSCPWTTANLQVVEHPGANVTRSQTSFTGLTADVSTPPNDLARTFVLYSWRLQSDAVQTCETMLSGTVQTNGLHFERGFGRSSCGNADVAALTYQRVEMGDGTQVFADLVLLGGAILQKTQNTGAMQPPLTTVFTGAMVGGLAGGMGRRTGNGEEADMAVNLSMPGPGVIQLERAASNDMAQFGVFAVQWAYP